MVSIELRPVLEETVGDEYWYVIHPRVSRCSGQKDPLVALRYFYETFHPSSVTDHTLFVEYKKRILHVGVLSDVVPAIDHDFVLVMVAIGIR